MNNETNTAANTNETPAVAPRGFERVPCGRCGGCGEYSYCAMYGTRCFGCAGSGVVLTKRGKLAKAHYERLLSKTAAELVAGCDAVQYSPTSKKFRTVTSVSPCPLNPGTVNVVLGEWSPGHTYTIGCRPETLFRVAASAETKAAALAAALAFEDSLTKTGTPRKR